MSGRLSAADPQNLEGKLQGAPREFFWDSITKYVAGLIIALAAIDSLIEFIRGSKISCLKSSISGNITDIDFVNIYCASSVPRAEYFPAYITVHALLILIPHAVWTNRYSGSFDFFFTQSRMIDRTRDYETGLYSQKNYIIADQLQKVFTNYKENQMFISYVFMLISQLVITLLGFFIAVFYFKNFKAVFLCPANFKSGSSHLTDEFWPLDKQILCAIKPLNLYAVIRIVDLVLLTILILSYLWSLALCVSSHPIVLGMNQVAEFTFQSSIPPRFFVFDSQTLRKCCGFLKDPLRYILSYVPFCGTGPYIHTNLDFLLLRLFRTDNGLGFMLRRMLIMSRIRALDNNDQRVVKLHRIQQIQRDMKGGDITSIDGSELAFDRDIKWKFPKVAGQHGLYNTPSTPFGYDDTLVLPASMRGIILGFSSLSTSRETAMFVTFGSTSMGIPCALARVFQKVIVLNFNPHFNMKSTDEEKFYHSNKYLSQIQSITYPEDILSSTCEKFEDWKTSLKDTKSLDFIVIGPIHKKFNTTTVSLCLTELAGKHFKEATLLTVLPTQIGGKDTTSEFYHYCPPEKYFKERNQRVRLRGGSDLLLWPPTPISNNKEGSAMLNYFAFKIVVGGTQCKFIFQVYQSAEESPTKDKTLEVSVVDEPMLTSVDPGEKSLATEMEDMPLLSGSMKSYS